MIPCWLTHSIVIVTIFWVFDWLIPDWQCKNFGWISSICCPLPFTIITYIPSRSSLVLLHQYYQQNIIFPFGYTFYSRISKQLDESTINTLSTLGIIRPTIITYYTINTLYGNNNTTGRYPFIAPLLTDLVSLCLIWTYLGWRLSYFMISTNLSRRPTV